MVALSHRPVKQASFLFANNMAKFLCSMGPKNHFFIDYDDVLRQTNTMEWGQCGGDRFGGVLVGSSHLVGD